MPFLEFRFIIGDINVDVAVRDEPAFIEGIFVRMAQRDELVVPLEVRKRESSQPSERDQRLWSLACFSFSAIGLEFCAAWHPIKSAGP